MRKLHKAAAAAAILVSFGLIGTGTAHAQSANVMHGGGGGCKSHDFNIDLIGNVGIFNGFLGNAFNGEGNPGAMPYHQGSEMGCDHGGHGY